MTFVPSKNPRNSIHMYKLQQTVNSEQSETPTLAYWTTGSKSPRTSTMATLVPRASLLGTRLLCNNNNHRVHTRARCMLVHHSNIEIDSNDSLFDSRFFRTRGGSCRTPHHRQEGLFPHAAPQTSGPNAARCTTDKWAYCRMPHHSGQMAILSHHK